MDVLIAHITEFYFNDLRDNLYRAKYIESNSNPWQFPKKQSLSFLENSYEI